MSGRPSFRIGAAGGRFAPDPAGLMERIVEHAHTSEAIRALLLLGSRARVDHSADEWSDTDLIVVVDDPDAFLADAGWPAHFGAVAITFVESTGHGRRERRVLYVDGTDLDLIPVPTDEVRGGPARLGGLAVMARGFRVLHDPEGMLADLSRWVDERAPEPWEEWPPQLVEFENLVSDFWYHAVWTARKLRRGELWVALDCLDGYMKRRLLTVVEWQARARDGGNGDPWFAGRFLERWADPETIGALGEAFARYDGQDIARALRATMDLFRRQATDLAIRLELPYPARGDEVATALVDELLPAQRREQRSRAE